MRFDAINTGPPLTKKTLVAYRAEHGLDFPDSLVDQPEPISNLNPH